MALELDFETSLRSSSVRTDWWGCLTFRSIVVYIEDYKDRVRAEEGAARLEA